jgi:hypothetical protein
LEFRRNLTFCDENECEEINYMDFTNNEETTSSDLDLEGIIIYRVIINVCPIEVGVGDVVECAASLMT